MGEEPFPREAECQAGKKKKKNKTLQWFQFYPELSVFIELEKVFNIQEGQNLQLRYKYAINYSKSQV